VRRLAATVATDVRVQLRNGFYAATAVIVIVSIALLRWLPPETATLLLPVVILENVLMNTFYFVSGLVLLERVEGTFVAQSVTPLRTGEYLGSKLLTLTALSLVESLLITVAVFGVARWLLAMAVGIVLTAALFCLVGVAVVVLYDSINEFLLPSVPCTFVLTLPLLGIFGIGAEVWYLPHPIQGPLSLMAVEAPHSAGRLAYAIGYPLLWIVPAYLWSRRALVSARSA
jgi:fluoroquinolone transport system permease protein